MKKIFYFIASAIVALGAVACQNDINEGVTPEQEGFSINVTIADQTRVALGNLDEETKQRKNLKEQIYDKINVPVWALDILIIGLVVALVALIILVRG